MPFLAVQLNQTNNALTKILPPTDSRKRADLQALEKGFIDEVMELKRIIRTYIAQSSFLGQTVLLHRALYLTRPCLLWCEKE